MSKIYLTLLLLTTSCIAYSQASPKLDSLFRNSYRVYELQRLNNGMYRDSKLFSGTDYHPVSISNTGMGLIALCIADDMGWINNAKALALTTLKTCNGNHPNFKPDRSANGYYRHFLDISTGKQAWNSEYSTIDTDILMSCALFAMKYFQDDSISFYTNKLWNSIDFEDAIADASGGKIYLTMTANGTGSGILNVYNEYMIVAWLAKNSSTVPTSPGHVMWNKFFQTTEKLPKITYSGHSVLSDNATNFLSSFTHQFNYYLCHHFTTSDDFLTYYANAQKADAAWWSTASTNAYEWGCGAGSAINGYHADAINNNADKVVSPHIIAGFLPVNPNGKNDLIDLWTKNKGKFTLPTGGGHQIIWRYSKTNTTWKAPEIIGIDYSTMLFGLATLPEYLGPNFFPTYNDFFPAPISTSNPEEMLTVKTYPNPFTDQITVELDRNYHHIQVNVRDIAGRLMLTKAFEDVNQFILPLKSIPGVYFLEIRGDGKIGNRKIVTSEE